MTTADDALAGSAHFTIDEFRCHHCGAVELDRELVWRLEDLRSRIGRPLPILSGYRCRVHNAAIGGARNSQHLRGRAADFRSGLVVVSQAKAAGFRGIGVCDGWVVHADVRPGRAVTFRDC